GRERLRGRRCQTPLPPLSGGAVAGDAGFGAEAVLDDLAIKRPAADVEHEGRFLLIPSARLEHPLELIVLVFRQSLQAARFRRRGWGCRERVQELDVGVPDD